MVAYDALKEFLKKETINYHPDFVNDKIRDIPFKCLSIFIVYLPTTAKITES